MAHPLDMCLPEPIRGYLPPPFPEDTALAGDFVIARPLTEKMLEPSGLGYIHLAMGGFRGAPGPILLRDWSL